MRHLFFFCDRDLFGGPKFINCSFAVLTVVITVALLLQIYNGDYQVAPHGSVASDNKECSTVGTTVLKNGGNSIDAAVASAFCLAIVNPLNTGLDAGGQMLIYSHATRAPPTVINFEKANLTIDDTLPRLAVGLAIAHEKFGTMPWKKLIEPSILLAKNNIWTPSSGSTDERFAIKALQKIADTSEKQFKRLILRHNLESQVAWTAFYDYHIYAPASHISSILFDGLTQLEKKNFVPSQVLTPEYTYELAKISEDIYEEAKFYQLETSSNIAIMDQQELYVSLIIGKQPSLDLKKAVTESSSHISLDTSSYIPLLIIDKYRICGRRLVTGASNIITALQIISSLIVGSNEATVGVENPRFTIKEDFIELENARRLHFDSKTIEYLETLKKIVDASEPYDSCNVVEKLGDRLNSHSDSRGGGIASRF